MGLRPDGRPVRAGALPQLSSADQSRVQELLERMQQGAGAPQGLLPRGMLSAGAVGVGAAVPGLPVLPKPHVSRGVMAPPLVATPEAAAAGAGAVPGGGANPASEGRPRVPSIGGDECSICFNLLYLEPCTYCTTDADTLLFSFPLAFATPVHVLVACHSRSLLATQGQC